MKQTQEVLEAKLMEIQQEVLTQQTKLGDITTAINREQLALEDKRQEVSLISKQEKDLSAKVGVLSNEVDNLTNRNNELAEKYKQELISYEAQRNELISESKEIESDNSSVLKGYVEEKRQLELDIEGLESEYSKKEKSLSTKVLSIQTKVDSLNGEKEQLSDEIKVLKSQLVTMNNDSGVLSNDIIDKLNQKANIDSDIKKASDKIEIINSTIETKIEEIKKIEEEKSQLNTELLDVRTNLLVAQGELSDLEEQKGEFVKRFISLDEREKANDKREEYLKSKYQQAGIVYP